MSSMGLSQSISQTQRQSLDQRMTQAQRQTLIQTQALQIRLQLIEALRGEKYAPEAVCPRCSRRMTPLEIITGFNRDPNDFNTTCSGCAYRFPPKLMHHSRMSRTELPFYCDVQTQAKLPGLETMDPEEFARKEPAIFHSAVVHNGTLKAAFAEIGIVYAFEEIVDPEKKIEPFLGELPDTIIAEVSGLSVDVIGKLRRKLGIPACTRAKMLESAMEN